MPDIRWQNIKNEIFTRYTASSTSCGKDLTSSLSSKTASAVHSLDQSNKVSGTFKNMKFQCELEF